MVKTTTLEGKDVPPIKDTLWLDGWKGKCHSGIYFRSDISKKISEFEKKFKGYKVVGITLCPDSFNVEFICEQPDKIPPQKVIRRRPTTSRKIRRSER